MHITLHSLQLIIYSWIAIAIFIFFLLRRVTAPYGRHTSTKWGPLIDNRLGWFIMEFPALLIMSYFFIKNLEKPTFIIPFMTGLFCLHYFNRTIIFPFHLHTEGKKIPLLIVCSAIFFNIIDTFLLGYYFANFATYDMSWLTDLRFIIGTILFFTGLYINWKADNMLIHLRKPGETGYKIPQGWLFKWVSCPNMMGELIEWGGFALLCWNLPALGFFIWSSANLVPRALSHHQWYKKKFPDYPVDRTAVVPYIV